jgi:hypothetical protein
MVDAELNGNSKTNFQVFGALAKSTSYPDPVCAADKVKWLHGDAF